MLRSASAAVLKYRSPEPLEATAIIHINNARRYGLNCGGKCVSGGYVWKDGECGLVDHGTPACTGIWSGLVTRAPCTYFEVSHICQLQPQQDMQCWPPALCRGRAH